MARAVHPFPSLLVTGVVLALVPLADPSASGSLYLRLGMGMLCYQFAIGLTNDLVDAADDAMAKAKKPIPAGLVSPASARARARSRKSSE